MNMNKSANQKNHEQQRFWHILIVII